MTYIIGHRGAHDLWAENSLAGFRQAVRLGCTAIEFDVHLTDAGELVVIHDPTLDRTTESEGEVRNLSPRARATTRLKNSAEAIPTLDDVLGVLAPVPNLQLHVEIKLDARGIGYPGIAGRVAERLLAHGLGKRAYLTSFDLGILRECKAEAPGIARLVSADPVWLSQHGGLPAFVGKAAPLVEIIALRHDLLAEKFEDTLTLWPLERLCVWTVNNPEDMRAWLSRRIGYLTTDRPDLALEMNEQVMA
ncbi:glycerophosphodiester phosphodiesterase family protein [Paracoccus saliphilus]|uniref:Glycerophosphodiester phosphodiesterase n=1 Tax=Paracoccus saliphilus TaxID=405559 RepID=A0AA46A6S3_9RHOB|nr:glycerophosphodiester phosphodiesterase family protein [Paracoccus saliphilus]WCR02923.1 glycerophosphodiester phosphodiesterase [Paracoccus saliphilus]SIT02889.1 glycerophosphoryl diester phosphodiesterase [Paracoccus saliphilus]